MKYYKKLWIIPAFLMLVACEDVAKWAFKPIEPTAPNLLNTSVPDDEVVISVLNDSISVGGLLNAEIKVLVGENVLGANANGPLILTINNTAVGTFPDAATPERLELPINANGEAFARIIPKGEGNLTLMAKIGEVERKAELSFFKKRTMVVDTTNAIADNYSVARIIFTGNATDINRDIVFETDRGTFSNNQSTYTTKVTNSENAIALLKNHRSERANIKVSILNIYNEQDDLTFRISYPDDIIIEAAASNLDRKNALNVGVKVRLLKTKNVFGNYILTASDVRCNIS